MIPIWPELKIDFKYIDDYFIESNIKPFRLEVLLSTQVRKQSNGNFYFFTDVIKKSSFAQKKLEEVINMVINEFTKEVYKVQLFQKYTEDRDYFGIVVHKVDHANYKLTEEDRIKHLYK